MPLMKRIFGRGKEAPVENTEEKFDEKSVASAEVHCLPVLDEFQVHTTSSICFTKIYG